MSEGNTLMLSLTMYKVVTIVAGLAFAYMGYKLFIHGIFMEAGEIRTNWDNRNLVLRKAAPGTFFALFGTLVICVSLWRGLTLGPSEGTGAIGGSGMFDDARRDGDDRNGQTPSAESRETVVKDVAVLNSFASDILRQRAQGEAQNLTVTVADSEQILDLIDRTKAALMLSVWSLDWGNRDEFRRWAYGAPGYAYSDPPISITRAATIFKGEGQ